MKKITYVLLVLTVILFFGNGLIIRQPKADSIDQSDKTKQTTLDIVTTTKAQYYMVKSIVKDRHNVYCLFDNEENIGELKVTDGIINKISRMDLFIYTGLNYEPWIDNMIYNLDKEKVGIIDMSRGVKVLQNELNVKNKDNPYYPLGFDEYKIALYNIKSAIQDKDTENRELYERNYNDSINKIKVNLDDKKIQLNKYKNIKIVTDTDVFDYFFENLGLNAIKVKDFKDIQDIRKNDENSKIILVRDKNSVIPKEEKEISDLYSIVNLTRYDSNKSFTEVTLSNIDIILEELKNLKFNS